MKSADIKKFISTTIFAGGHPSYINPNNWVRDYKYKASNHNEFYDKVGLEISDLHNGDILYGSPPPDNVPFIVRQFSMVDDDEVSDVTLHVLTDVTDSAIVYCSGTRD